MIIIGAKGFAKEVLEILYQMNYGDRIMFFDDVSEGLPKILFNKFMILRNLDEVKVIFNNDNRFTIGIGKPSLRYQLSKKFEEIDGNIVSTISPFAHIGHFNNMIDSGVNIMTGTVITNEIQIGKGVLINLNCTIGHDSVIERFCELSPGVHISGHSYIEEFTTIGTGAVILPGIRIGRNSIIGAGAVVNKDIPPDSIAIGMPAKVVRKNESFES